MTYHFQPLSDEQLENIGLVEKGKYRFEVVKSVRKTSKANNPMAELSLQIWDNQGISHLLFDYLVFSNVPLNIRKVKHFCDTVGLHEEYKRGELRGDLAGLCGDVEIDIQAAQPNPNGGMYQRKNIVVDYIKKEKIKNDATNDFFNDPVPNFA